MPSPGRCTLWALAVAVGSLCSCGGSEQSQTCLEKTITYTGSKSGAAYSRLATADGTLYIPSNAASIQFLILAESGNVYCSGGGNPIDRPFTWTVWIDVSGTAAASCADLSNPNPQCQPSPGDPQAHQSGVLRFGQLTQIRLDVVDPVVARVVGKMRMAHSSGWEPPTRSPWRATTGGTRRGQPYQEDESGA